MNLRATLMTLWQRPRDLRKCAEAFAQFVRTGTDSDFTAYRQLAHSVELKHDVRIAFGGLLDPRS